MLSARHLDLPLSRTHLPKGFDFVDTHQAQLLKGAVPRDIMRRAQELRVTCCALLHEDDRTMAGDCPWASTNMACGHFYEGQSDIAVSTRISQLAEIAHVFGMPTEELLAHRDEIDWLSKQSKHMDYEHAQKGYAALNLQGPDERAPGHAALKRSLIRMQQSLGASVKTLRGRLLRFLEGIEAPAESGRIALPLV